MSIKGRISIENLARRLYDICEGIEQNGDVWEVVGPEGRVFMLGPPSVCGRVLGLYDVEYGWRNEVHIDDAYTTHQLMPGHRYRPFLMREGRCVAVAVHLSEYEDILKLLEEHK